MGEGMTTAYALLALVVIFTVRSTMTAAKYPSAMAKLRRTLRGRAH